MHFIESSDICVEVTCNTDSGAALRGGAATCRSPTRRGYAESQVIHSCHMSPGHHSCSLGFTKSADESIGVYRDVVEVEKGFQVHF